MSPQEHRAKKVIETVGRRAETVNQRFWFLDLKFTQFATPRLIGFIFVLYVLFSIAYLVFLIAYALLYYTVIEAVAVMVVGTVMTLISAVFVRVFLEAFLVIFRIAENLSHLRHLRSIADQKRNG